MFSLFNKSIISISIFASLALLNGCSAPSIQISDAHAYNKDYGVIPNTITDNIIIEEVQSINDPVEISYQLDDPSYTTELRRDPEAFLAEEWVQPEPVDMYKYDDDSKFYTAEELPENKLKLGNVIVRIPADKSMLFSESIASRVERASTPMSGY